MSWPILVGVEMKPMKPFDQIDVVLLFWELWIDEVEASA